MNFDVLADRFKIELHNKTFKIIKRQLRNQESTFAENNFDKTVFYSPHYSTAIRVGS